MTTLEDVARQLPNGFHDAEIREYTVDWVMRTATFEVHVWTGDPDAGDVGDRESYRSARLVLRGLVHCYADPPDARYPFTEAKPLRVDLCEAEPREEIARAVPPHIFQVRFYVSNWNSFIHLAAEDSAFCWVDGAPGAG